MHTDPHFNISTRVYNFISEIFNDVWSIVKIAFFFVVFSLPVITVFASFGAAVRCLVKLDQNNEAHILENFWEFFKTEFWKSSIVGFLCLLTMYACVLSGTYYYVVTMGSGVQYISIVLFATLFLFSFLFCTAYYTVRASVDLPFFACLKNAAYLIFLSIMVDFGLLVALIMLLVLIYLKQSLLLILPLIWILYTRLCVYCYGKQICKYMIQHK